MLCLHILPSFGIRCPLFLSSFWEPLECGWESGSSPNQSFVMGIICLLLFVILIQPRPEREALPVCVFWAGCRWCWVCEFHTFPVICFLTFSLTKGPLSYDPAPSLPTSRRDSNAACLTHHYLHSTYGKRQENSLAWRKRNPNRADGVGCISCEF